MHEFRRSILALCALVPVCLPAMAQTPNTAALAGQIVDAGGAAIVGARIEARQLDGAADIHLLSDQEGRYSLISLPLGRYEIHVDHAGFQDLKRQVQVFQANNEALILPLAVSSLTESVTVNGQSSLITETPTGQTQTSVSREDFAIRPPRTSVRSWH